MAGSSVSSSDRNAMITMFIVAYAICILCAIIPLYGFFGLPDKAKDISYFKVDKRADKDQKELIASFDAVVLQLDSLLNAANFGSRYSAATLEMRTLTNDLKKAGNPYQTVFAKIADLYDQIQKYCEKSTTVDQLTKENADLTKALDDKKKEFDDYKKMQELMDKLKAAQGTH